MDLLQCILGWSKIILDLLYPKAITSETYVNVDIERIQLWGCLVLV